MDVTVLAVDDDKVEHVTLSRLLGQGGVGYSYRLESCCSIAQALERLQSSPPIDVVLLDLGLPGTRGIETVTEFGPRISDYPVIILTGNTDQGVAQRAIHMGAEDYLDKSGLTAEMLQRSIRYAVERFALKRDVERARYERELNFVEDVASDMDSPVTSRLYGQRALRVSTPSTFEGLVAAYAEAITDAMEQRAYRVEHRLSDRLQSMGETLGRLLAKPRDVVEIHTEALRAQREGESPARVRAAVEESRYLLLELVGYLCAYYRRQAVDVGASVQRQDEAAGQ